MPVSLWPGLTTYQRDYNVPEALKREMEQRYVRQQDALQLMERRHFTQVKSSGCCPAVVSASPKSESREARAATVTPIENTCPCHWGGKQVVKTPPPYTLSLYLHQYSTCTVMMTDANKR